ncbi:SDR family oxidoreductase [Zoogloea sp.]|uniref:SDR family oxidoreductase n=1 Tax=Zoogloea sp. TaxID=49181 RepID=UPI0025CE263E|nr:SDR family oxidoreductase [Zoogloea sp.]MCK6393118.1 SDR family oxidoreductase [Zoogloea sp.]
MTHPASRVFITGASSGIGEALARHYAARGASLGLVGRRVATLEALVASLPGKHAVYGLDVADPVALGGAAADFMARFGLPDVVIANAGVSVGTLTEMVDDLAAFERVLRTNVLGMVATFQPFVAPLRAAGQGRLVGIASVAGIRGLPGAGAYSASKAAVIAYLESLRVELHGTGVRVVTIAPGYIETPMTAVNSYPMPFLIPADQAAARFAGAIEAGVSYTVIPWQMGWVAKLLRLLPNPVFDRLFARAGRKPRGLPL